MHWSENVELIFLELHTETFFQLEDALSWLGYQASFT